MKRKNNFFSVIGNSQTYLNMLYLLLSFILGIFYFVILVTGISLGFGLIITLIGIPLLVGVIFLWKEFAYFERDQAIHILGMKLPLKKQKKIKGFWRRLWRGIKEPFTWKSLGYLFLKFPLGIFSFVLLVTLLSVSLSFIAIPFGYYLTNIQTLIASSCADSFCFAINNGFSSIILGVIGVFFLFISLHVFNWIAKISGLLTKGLLKR